MPLIAHFLNVGRGDCTIIQFPSGRVAMIDIDHLRTLDSTTKEEILAEYHESQDYLLNVGLSQLLNPGFASTRGGQLDEEYLRRMADTFTDPLAYFDTYVGRDRPIFRLIVTHPDMDHMSGLYRLVVQERRVVENFWHSGPHDLNLANADWGNGCPYDERDWKTYKWLRAGGAGPTSLARHQGDVGNFWTEDGIEILAPTPELVRLAVARDEPNILSTVLRISYRGVSIVLGGDATADETWPTILPRLGRVNILKAAHHGRKTGYFRPAVQQMAPWLTITSVGEREHDATPSYRRYSEHTVSLRNAGDVRITIADDGKWYYSPNVAEHWKLKTTEPTLSDLVALLVSARS